MRVLNALSCPYLKRLNGIMYEGGLDEIVLEHYYYGSVWEKSPNKQKYDQKDTLRTCRVYYWSNPYSGKSKDQG
jgi:hypothetical protein